VQNVINRTAAPQPRERSRAWVGWRLSPAWKAFIVACLLLPLLVVGSASAEVAKVVATPAGAPAPGTWIKLGSSHAGGPATLWRGPDDRDWVVWAVNGSTYEVAILAPDGGFSKAPTKAFTWSSVAADPTLISNGKEPLLVFSGQGPGKYAIGDIFGAVPGTPWTPQSWSLAHDTDSSGPGYGGAAVNAKGVISAAWEAIGGGVQYRIGVSKSIPAAGPDNSFLIGDGAEAYLSEAVDTNGNGHFYVALDRFFSNPGSADGLWVKDLSANGPVMKAPDSGTPSTNLLQSVAFANSTSKHGGVYLAYCANINSSHVLLWRVGSKTPLVVPDSAGARLVNLVSGPDGRLWITWWNEYGPNANTFYTVRTNEADTKFGPVESYNTVNLFFTVNTIALGGGNFGRLDVVIAGTNAKSLAPTILTTQSLTGLTLSPGSTSITNTASRKVTFTVPDAGDPVAGAYVKVDGHSATTSAAGTATITFAKGTTPNTYKVTASRGNYFSATAKVVVTK